MPLTRRHAVTLGLSLPVLSLLHRPDVHAADEGNALFWRLKAAASQAILFGYVRARAAAFPEVIRDGKRHIDETGAFITDLDPATTLTTMTFDNDDLKPVFLQLPKADQDELSRIFAGSPAVRAFSRLTALELNILLIGEGQQGFDTDNPSLGHTLMIYAQSTKRRIATLITKSEVEALSKPLTLDLANGVSPDSVVYLLGLRRRVGPIGTHLDTLYGARKSGEIARLGDEMTSRGVLDLTQLVDTQRLRALVIDRLANLPAGTKAFVTLPIGLLAGPYSICDALRARGAEVTAIG